MILLEIQRLVAVSNWTLSKAGVRVKLFGFMGSFHVFYSFDVVIVDYKFNRKYVVCQ